MNEETNGRAVTDGWTDGLTDTQRNRRRSGRTNGWMELMKNFKR